MPAVSAQLVSEAVPPQADSRVEAFLGLLFRTLDECGTRYCVLHSYERLPELPSDIDLAVHPADTSCLQAAFEQLANRGYSILQEFNYAVGGTYFIFAWFEEFTLRTVAVDVITEHRRAGLMFASGERLLAGRTRYSSFWIAAPHVQFSYLLAKAVLKRSVDVEKEAQIHRLAVGLGWETCVTQATELFGHRLAMDIVSASFGETLRVCLDTLAPSLRRSLYVRHCRTLVGWFWREFCRAAKRWFRPTGLSIALIGPDGVGKSTLLQKLLSQLEPLFRRQRSYHWRASVLWSEKDSPATTQPHVQRKSTATSSTIRLTAHFIDCWLGHVCRVRPLLARSGLVLLDRCFQDIEADPLRYRYTGPAWVSRVLSRLAPKTDLTLIVDAPEDIILSRKQEITATELNQQRSRYLLLSTRFPFSAYIDAGESADVCLHAALQSATKLLSVRYKTRNGLSAHSTLLLKLSFAISHACRSEEQSPLPRPLRADRRAENYREELFCALPSVSKTRWLVPLSDRRMSGRAMDMYTPYARVATMVHPAAKALLLSGWKGFRRNWFRLPASQWELLQGLVREKTGVQDPVFAFSFSSSPRLPKVSVQIMNKNAAVIGYLKVALAESAVARIRGEARVLAQLRSIAPLRSRVPQVLFSGEWGDTYILLQSALRGRPGPAAFTDSHSTFLALLATVERQKRDGVEFVNDIRMKWSEAEVLLDAASRMLGDQALAWTTDVLRGVNLDCSLAHGDFAPWNTRTSGGTIYVFDWESAASGMPALWDYFHFQIQVRILLGRRCDLWREAPDTGVNRAVLTLYLLASTAALIREGVQACEAAIRLRQALLSQLLSCRQ